MVFSFFQSLFPHPTSKPPGFFAASLRCVTWQKGQGLSIWCLEHRRKHDRPRLIEAAVHPSTFVTHLMKPLGICEHLLGPSDCNTWAEKSCALGHVNRKLRSIPAFVIICLVIQLEPVDRSWAQKFFQPNGTTLFSIFFQLLDVDHFLGDSTFHLQKP